MRVLHLLSNWKWTERAEPAADLALAQQRAGAEVVFACCAAPGPQPGSAAEKAAEKGIARVAAISLPKHFSPLTARRAVGELRALLETFRPDVVHAHMTNAHLLAALAGRGSARRPIVRSVYEPDGPPPDMRTAWLFARRTDGAVVITERARMEIVRRFRLPFDAVCVAEPGIDLGRFGRAADRDAARRSFGLPADRFVAGLVSRIREARRIDLAIDAVERMSGAGVDAGLLVVGRGRGDAVERLVLEPARRKGIAGRVVAAGYCSGQRLVEAYSAMDALVYPVHGTDPSCRTVREAMASGLPVVAPRSGFVTELVSHGTTGYLTGHDPAEMASRLAQLAGSPSARSRMARLALETARARFDPARAAAVTLDLYARLAGAGAARAAFVTTRLPGATWRVAHDFNGGRPPDIQRTPPAADIIQSRKGRTCFRVAGPGGLPAVVKRHRPRAFIERLKYAVAPSRARAEWRNSAELAASGVSTPRALAWAESRRFGLWAGSELVMEGVFPGTALSKFLEKPEPGVGLAAAAQDLAVQLARVHSAGFRHRDLHGGNILVGAGRRTGRVSFHLIDLHEAKRTAAGAGRAAAVDDLGRLNSSVKAPARLKLLFLRRYIACRGWPPRELKPLAREIDARTRAIWARHLLKHGTHIETYGA